MRSISGTKFLVGLKTGSHQNSFFCFVLIITLFVDIGFLHSADSAVCEYNLFSVPSAVIFFFLRTLIYLLCLLW